MPFGTPPYIRDFLDELIDRRSRIERGYDPNRAVDTAMRRDPMAERIAPPRERLMRRQGGIRGALGQAIGTAGQEGIAAGIQAGQETEGFGNQFLAGLGASLQAGNRSRAASAAQESDRAMQERQFGLAERRVKAEELRAGREPIPRTPAETTAQEFQAEIDALKGLGATPEEIKAHFLSKGSRGGGGSGRETDLQRVAGGLVATGRARDMNEAYVLAKTLTQQPQMVGSIERTVTDRRNPLNTTVRRVNISRRMNQTTGDFETLDEMGNLVTQEDMITFRNEPATFAGGSGGSLNDQTPPPPPPPSGSGGGTAFAPVPSHAAGGPSPSPTTLSDFRPGPGQGYSEEEALGILAQVQNPQTLRAYAAGRGPLGNSTKLKMLAAQKLKELQDLGGG